jgi:hypothetical protein
LGSAEVQPKAGEKKLSPNGLGFFCFIDFCSAKKPLDRSSLQKICEKKNSRNFSKTFFFEKTKIRKIFCENSKLKKTFLRKSKKHFRN